METLLLILVAGGLMSLLALTGGLVLLVPQRRRMPLMKPLVALAAGTLIGSALFFLLPRAVQRMPGIAPWFWVAIGFTGFFLIEAVLRWRHGSGHGGATPPVSYLVLLGDGMHNLAGGVAVGGAFVADPRIGAAAWLAAACHEIPQELGDFSILVDGGWSPRRALLWNFVSALTFPVGAVAAWAVARVTSADFLLALAAGNYLYIAAADLIPEVQRREYPRETVAHAGCFMGGLAGLFLLRIVLP